MNNPAKGRPSFITGSTLVKGIEPKDKDIAVLCKSQQEAFDISKEDGYTEIETSMAGDPRFVSVRYYSTNYILIWTDERFWRMKAFAGALELLQIEDKDDRIRLSSACLYGKWEITAPAPIDDAGAGSD